MIRKEITNWHYTVGLQHYEFPNKKCSIHATAKLYRNINFRPDIELIMEENTFIMDGCTILVPKLVMRKGSQICAGTVLAGRDSTVLDENVVIGYNCLLLTSSDLPSGEFMNDVSPEERRDIKSGRIYFQPNSYLGSHSLVMPDVEIHKGIVIRAFSYIDKNLTQEYFIYDGNKPIIPRNIR